MASEMPSKLPVSYAIDGKASVDGFFKTIDRAWDEADMKNKCAFWRSARFTLRVRVEGGPDNGSILEESKTR